MKIDLNAESHTKMAENSDSFSLLFHTFARVI